MSVKPHYTHNIVALRKQISHSAHYYPVTLITQQSKSCYIKAISQMSPYGKAAFGLSRFLWDVISVPLS